MSVEARLRGLLTEVGHLAKDKALPDGFLAENLEQLPYIAPIPRVLRAVENMLRAPLPTGPATAALTDAIHTAAHDLHWMQSYSQEQVGAHFLEQYAYFNLISPEGPFLSKTIRVSVGYWGQGLIYPKHRHAPEEVYCVLAGGATFQSGTAPPVHATPGVVIHHPPNMPHSLDMSDSALIALAFWRGTEVLQPSVLEHTP